MERSKDNHCGSSHRKERKKEKGTPPNKIQTQPNDQMKINKPLAPFSAAKFKKKLHKSGRIYRPDKKIPSLTKINHSLPLVEPNPYSSC